MSDHDENTTVEIPSLIPDAAVDLWILLAESLVASGVLKVEVIQAVLANHAEIAAGSLSAHMARRALSAFEDPPEKKDPPGKPDWFHGVVDGDKDA